MSNFSISQKYHSETFWIAGTFFDRYTTEVTIMSKKKFYLIAHGAIFIAAKLHEELLEPRLEDLVGQTKYKITETMIKVHYYLK